MSFGTAIGETDHDYCNAAANYVWVNDSAHLIVMIKEIRDQYSWSYRLRDYEMTLYPSTPKLPTSQVDITPTGIVEEWNPGTPTAVYDPIAGRLLYIYVGSDDNVTASHTYHDRQILVDSRGHGFVVITTASGFIVVTAASDYSEIYLTTYIWQKPGANPTFGLDPNNPTITITGTQGLFDPSATMCGAVIMSLSLASGFEYTLHLALRNSSSAFFVLIPINVANGSTPFGVSDASNWSQQTISNCRLSGICLAPDGLPIGLVSGNGDTQFLHYIPPPSGFGWSTDNTVGWETWGPISTLSGSDAVQLSLGYYFFPNGQGTSTDVYQLIVEPDDSYYGSSVEHIGTLTLTAIPARLGLQDILLGIIEGCPPVPLENLNLPTSDDPNVTQGATTTYFYTEKETITQTISFTNGFLLQASGGGNFGVGVQFNVEFDTNFSHMKQTLGTGTNCITIPEDLSLFGSAGAYQVQSVGLLVLLTSDFGINLFQFMNLNGEQMPGSISYAQVFMTNGQMTTTPYAITPNPNVDLGARPYLPPTLGDLSTYYPGDGDAQTYYNERALKLVEGNFFIQVPWSVSSPSSVLTDFLDQTTVTSSVSVDLQTMIGTTFGSDLTLAQGSISAGYSYSYQNSKSVTQSTDIGLGVIVGPLQGTTETPDAYKSYSDYSVQVYQLKADPIYWEWLVDDLGAGSTTLQGIAPGAQPWKIVYLVTGSSVNNSPIPTAPVVTIGSGNLSDPSQCPNPPWVPNYQVRYAVSFYGGTDQNKPDWETPKGAWSGWQNSATNCGGNLSAIPLAPPSWSDNNGIGRKVYRQFLGGSAEYVGNIPDNTTTTFVDGVSSTSAAA